MYTWDERYLIPVLKIIWRIPYIIKVEDRKVIVQIDKPIVTENDDELVNE